jgi:hypothetical protein
MQKTGSAVVVDANCEIDCTAVAAVERDEERRGSAECRKGMPCVDGRTVGLNIDDVSSWTT